MIYFSQLDMFRLFMRALRRSDFEVLYTCGFNPHPKMSLSQALKLGKAGKIQAIFYFRKELNPGEFKQRFSEQIPPDLKIMSIEIVKKQ